MIYHDIPWHFVMKIKNIIFVSKLRNKKVYKPAPTHSVHPCGPSIDREDNCQRRWALFKQLCPSFSSPSVRFFLFSTLLFNNFDMKHFEHLKPIWIFFSNIKIIFCLGIAMHCLFLPNQNQHQHQQYHSRVQSITSQVCCIIQVCSRHLFSMFHFSSKFVVIHCSTCLLIWCWDDQYREPKIDKQII